jgi:hypothetical protein
MEPNIQRRKHFDFHSGSLSLFASLIFQSLLDEPNPNSPANSAAAQLYQENRREYEKMVIKCVEESWKDTDVPDGDAPEEDADAAMEVDAAAAAAPPGAAAE